MTRARKPPTLALVRDDKRGTPRPRPWRRTRIYPSVDGALVLAVLSADDARSSILFFVQMSIETTSNSFEELISVLEDFSLRHYPSPPNLSLSGSGDAGP